MRKLPILFNTEMVRAILDGRKTQTRRLMKPQPVFLDGESGVPEICDDGNFTFRIQQYKNVYDGCFAPPCGPGDVLWVRETWCKGRVEYGEEPDGRNVPYIEQCTGDDCIIQKEWAVRHDVGIEDVVWKPSIHMPREAARIFLRVKDVRVEQLQDIDDDGVVAEGLRIGAPFDELWDRTVKKKDRPTFGWAANPWVWVIEFNIEHIEGRKWVEAP